MRVAYFSHSILSDWNHGNAHFLRGLVSELVDRGHQVTVYEPRDSWSLQNLLLDAGPRALGEIERWMPEVAELAVRYGADLDLDRALDGIDLVIVHEWNDHALVGRIGAHRRGRRYRLLFHDTHHRSVTAPAEMSAYDLSGYDGVLAFGRVIRDLYLARGWTRRAWTLHEAADCRRFRPEPGVEATGALIWIGNWGDEERTAELHEFLIGPVKRLGLRARVHGVRYPDHARRALADANIEYGGWLPSPQVPRAFAAHLVTVHVPRRPYATLLPGIPTIRPFEALACGIPLISAPWRDTDRMFTAGRDYLVARDGEEMTRQLRTVLAEPAFAAELARHGLATIRARHTCAHRATELLAIAADLEVPA